MKIFTSWPLYIVTALFGIGCVSGIVIPIFDYYSNFKIAIISIGIEVAMATIS